MHAIPTWAIGTVLAAVIATLARRFGALTTRGAAAAWVAGVAAMGAGWSWGSMLIAYFVVSATLSRVGRDEKRRRMAKRIEKPGARDAAQVLANGGVFVLMALGYWWQPDVRWQLAAAGAIAASAADTWATELGSLASASPRSILTLRPVPVGTSGGITGAGLVASLVASFFVAALAIAGGWPTGAMVAAVAGGISGSLIDSVLGAAFQARYWCETCQVETEARQHWCGSTARYRRGFRFLNNDGVNALATAAGAAVGLAAA